MKYKSLIVSDIHCGISHSRVKELNKILKDNTFDNIFLNGDIIDMTNFKSSFYWDNETTKFIRKILKLSKKSKVVYLIGNHDYFLEMFLGENLANITFCKEYFYTTLKGEKVLLLHGDCFDGVITKMKWLYWLGDNAYSFALFLNFYYNKIRSFFGGNYWSLSKYLKSKVKSAIQFVNNFEHLVVQKAKNENVDTIICGHIHVYDDKVIDGIRYMNSGDFVENNSYIIEDLEGNLILKI